MDSKELKPICSVGMFDLMKGIAILCVIIGHTASSIITPEHHPVMNPLSTLGNFFLCGMVIAAGFWIRRRPVGKCAAHLKSLFLGPYIAAASVAVILCFVNDFFLYGSISSALKQGFVCLLRYLIAFKSSVWIGDFVIEPCGALWFLFALAGGWFLLNLLLNYSQGNKRHFLVVLAGIIGYYGNLCSEKFAFQLPFCLFYMLIFVPLLYVGYLSRERRLFEEKLTPTMLLLICLSLTAFAWRKDMPYFLGLALQPLGVFTNFAACIASFALVYLMVRINRRENPVTGFLESIGRNSLYIYCIHATEEHGIPWMDLRELLPNSSGPHSFFVILVLRMCYIAIGMMLLTRFREWGGFSRLKEQLSRKKAVKAQ